MVTQIRSSERGTVLVLALIIVAFMAVLVVDAASVATVELEASRNADKQLLLEYACRGGYQLGEAYLRQDLIDSPDTDSLVDQWADPNGHEQPFDPDEAGGGYSEESSGSGFDTKKSKMSVRIRIEDEERKWPLALLLVNNEATQERRVGSLKNVIDRFRENTAFDIDAGAAEQMARAIYEYVKRKEGDAGSFGPTPRPGAKSGMILTPADLSLIPGIPPSVVFDQIDTENDTIAKGLMHFLTPWTDLQINVNTASLAVLEGLFRGDRRDEIGVAFDIFDHREKSSEELAEKLGRERSLAREGAVERRTGSQANEEEETAGSVFQTVDDVERNITTMTTALFNDTRTLMTVSSKTFTIWVEASLGKSKRMRRYVVRRDGPRYRLILSEWVTYPVYFPEESEAPEGLFQY